MGKVLWGACSQPGSLFPAVPVILELLRRGHQVTALCDPGSEPTFAALGCDFVPALQAAAVSPPARPLTRETKATWFSASTLALFGDAMEALRREAFDVVLADPLEGGPNFAAEEAGLPCVSYVHWGMNERGPDVPFCFHLWDREQPVDTAFAQWWNGLRAAVGLPPEHRPITEHRWYRTSPQLTLLLGLPELVHPKGVLPPGAVRVGPTAWEPPLSQKLPDWAASLGEDRPAILVSISTIASAEDADVIATVAEAADALGLELVVTLPINCDLPPLNGSPHVTTFLPHSALLDRVSAFVNHAGNGSVNRAALAGVPVLLMPTGRDQFEVARGATSAGFAITLQPGQRDLPNITESLEQLIHNPKCAHSAHSLAARGAAYRAPQSAADQIEALLR